MSHTPGPWLFDDYEGMVKSVEQYSNGRRCIATVLEGAESSANARLIAAAPEMLKALQVLFGQEGAFIGMSFSDRLLMAQAAIVKATGAA